MKVAVVGAAGKAGSLLVTEALSHGHDVTAIVRPGSAGRVTQDCTILEKDLFELTAEDLNGIDALIDAFGSRPGHAEEHITSLRHLTGLVKHYPEMRLIVVGGAGSLYSGEDETGHVIDLIPEEYRAVPAAMAEAFEELKQSGVRWTYFSPAANFDPKGRRIGRYILGTDYLLPNSFGESYISYGDYALALMDELDRGDFIGKRFTAVSDTSAIEKEKKYNIFNIANGSGFTRRGSYFGIYARRAGFALGGMGYGNGALSIRSRRGGYCAMPNTDLFRLVPMYEGHKIPYAIRTTATELSIVSLFGRITCCFADPNLLYIRGKGKMSLRLERDMNSNGELVKRRGPNAWEEQLMRLCDLVINPLKGHLDMKADWAWETLTTPHVRALITPDENDEFLITFDESTRGGVLRDSYPTYEEALADVTAEWEEFLSKFPKLERPLDEYREEAAWILWSYLVDASGVIKRPLIFMTGNAVASSWQMAQNAVALSGDIDLSIELLLNMLDEASPTGQLPDFYDDVRGQRSLYKPPLQGWALKWLMKKHDLGKEVAREKLERLYDGFSAWADWFFKYRDDDGDGIPAYEHGDETGFDDTTVFKKSPIMATPDLTAYLALLYEALGDLSEILGTGKKEEHYARSKELIDLMVKTFWNGERFVALTGGDHEIVATDSILYYLPIILGDRLPKEIIDQMVRDLKEEGEFLTGYGFASERLSGDGFRAYGWARGFVMPPVNLFLVTGLYEAGEVDFAKKVALRYCDSMRNMGFNMLINPMVGNFGGAGSSWTACAYLILADLYSNL